MGKKVTVVIPVYNMGKYLEECLDSVVCQTLTGLEVIAVNDGSTDNSLEILNCYSKRYSNILVYTQENQGQAVAKNFGIQNAKGKYIIIMDPDDYYPDNECIEKLYNCAEEHQAMICAGMSYCKREGDDSVFGPEITDMYHANQFIDIMEYNDMYRHQRYLFNRKFIVDNNILFPVYRRFEDPPFTLKALCLAGGFWASDIPIYIHRIEHKTVSYTLEVCKDIMMGVRAVTLICKEYQLENMYSRALHNIYATWPEAFLGYTDAGISEVDDIFEDVNRIFQEWKGNNYPLITRNEVSKIKAEGEIQYNRIKKILTDGKPVILYGAGYGAKIFMNIFRNYCDNVIGFAVSQDSEIKMYEGIKVCPIEQYVTDEWKKDAHIIITTMSDLWEDITEVLAKLQFKNVHMFDLFWLRIWHKVQTVEPLEEV